MASRIIIVAIALALSAWLGIKVAADPGYVLLSYMDWTVEMPLWLFAVISVVVMVVIYFLLRLLYQIRFGHKHWQNWRARKQEKRVMQWLESGLQAFIESDLSKAEKAFVKAARKSKSAEVYYLMLADLANQQMNVSEAKKFLAKAMQAKPKQSFAMSLAKARLLKADTDPQTLILLEDLATRNPKHVGLLRLLLTGYQYTQSWQGLLALLPKCVKMGVIGKAEQDKLMRSATKALIEKYRQIQDWAAIENVWAKLPRGLQSDVGLLASYCQSLIVRGDSSRAEKLLKHAIKKQYNSELVKCYGQLEDVMLDKQLAQAEKWVKTHPDDHVLLLVLGELCIKHRLWGKARDYLERALEHRVNSAVCRALGFVLEQLKENHAAMDIYRRGLSLM